MAAVRPLCPKVSQHGEDVEAALCDIRGRVYEGTGVEEELLAAVTAR